MGAAGPEDELAGVVDALGGAVPGGRELRACAIGGPEAGLDAGELAGDEERAGDHLAVVDAGGVGGVLAGAAEGARGAVDPAGGAVGAVGGGLGAAGNDAGS